jgi:hypothetical protein
MAYDLTNIVSISVFRDRKNGIIEPDAERKAAVQRGIVAWKRSNHRKMKEADELRRKTRKTVT